MILSVSGKYQPVIQSLSMKEQEDGKACWRRSLCVRPEDHLYLGAVA
jgi:hypothetical protein